MTPYATATWTDTDGLSTCEQEIATATLLGEHYAWVVSIGGTEYRVSFPDDATADPMRGDWTAVSTPSTQGSYSPA